MDERRYWTASWRLNRRNLLRSAALGGTGLALVACSSSNNKKSAAPATGAATQPGTPAATRAVGGASPSAGGAATGTAAARATTASTRSPAQLAADKSISDKDFFNSLPSNPAKDWADADVKAGGQLKRLFNREAATYDFHASVTGTVAEIVTPVYSGLIRLSNRQGLKDAMIAELEPDLASKWEQPDKTTLLFTLNKGITWQNVDPLNGRAFAPDDVKYSFDRGKTFPKSLQKESFKFVDRVEDMGNGQVKLALAQPNPGMQTLIGTWIMKIMPHEIGDNPDVAQKKAVGTGGFILDKATPNVEIVFRKNPNFFKIDSAGHKQPYLDGYSLAIVNDPATLSAVFQKGDADTHYATASPLVGGIANLRAFMEKNPNVVVQKHPGFYGAFSYIPHYDKAPFNDVRVRRALSMSYDRQSILDGVYLGQGSAVPFLGWPLIFDKPPTLDELGPNYKYDPKTAKQLLAGAGFANGVTVDLQWSYDSDNDVALFKQYAADAGFTINLVKSTDIPTHLKTYAEKSWKDLVLVGRGFNYPDANDFLQYYQPGSPLNYGNVDDPKLNDLTAKQIAADGQDRKAILKQIWDLMLDQVYEVTQPSGPALVFWQNTVKNWVDTGWNANAGVGSGQMDAVWMTRPRTS